MPSVTLSTTAFAPTFASAGAPESFAVPFPVEVKVNQLGLVGAVIVNVAPELPETVILYV